MAWSAPAADERGVYDPFPPAYESGAPLCLGMAGDAQARRNQHVGRT